MKKVDLITGLLGSGKTTFIAEYARRLHEEGQRVCLIANDYGAISIDRALLLEKLGDICDIEMVVAGDPDCQRRRFRTKLISLGMLGYDRVIVEPSGVFDVEEFYNILYDDSIHSWYEIGNVIGIVSAVPSELSVSSEYLLTDQMSTAGLLVVSKLQEQKGSAAEVEQKIREKLVRNAGKFHCTRDFSKAPMLVKDWGDFSEEDWKRIEQAGRVSADMVRMHFDEDGSFQNLFYFHVNRTGKEMRQLVGGIFADRRKYGHVIRVKGFFRDAGNGAWSEINATEKNIDIHPSGTGADVREEVIIVVGEHMDRTAVGKAFGETRSVTDYSI